MNDVKIEVFRIAKDIDDFPLFSFTISEKMSVVDLVKIIKSVTIDAPVVALDAEEKLGFKINNQCWISPILSL